MAHMIFGNTDMEDLRKKAARLGSAARSLATLFEQEAVRLKRMDEVGRLTTLRAAIARRTESARRDENGASCSYSEVRAIRRIAGSVAGLIAKTNNDWPGVISHALIDPPADGEPPFGTVLVRIGPGGVPEDVHVVSVSRLARESRQKQLRVIEELQKSQNLLLTEESFSELMDRLANKILEGKLSLPISPQTILQIQASRQLPLNTQDKD